MRPIPRRSFLAGAASAAAAPLLPPFAFAATPTGTKLHGLSAFGEGVGRFLSSLFGSSNERFVRSLGFSNHR